MSELNNLRKTHEYGGQGKCHEKNIWSNEKLTKRSLGFADKDGWLTPAFVQLVIDFLGM